MHTSGFGRKGGLRKGLAEVGSAWIWQSAALSAFPFTLCRCADHFIVLLLLNCSGDFAVLETMNWVQLSKVAALHAVLSRPWLSWGGLALSTGSCALLFYNRAWTALCPPYKDKGCAATEEKGKEGQQVDLSTCNMFSLIYVKLFDQIALHLNETIEPGYSI